MFSGMLFRENARHRLRCAECHHLRRKTHLTYGFCYDRHWWHLPNTAIKPDNMLQAVETTLVFYHFCPEHF